MIDPTEGDDSIVPIGPAERLFVKRFGLDVHELRVLRLIDEQPGVTFTRLAALTKFERSATSRILSRLVKASLVRRKIDEDDARQFQLFATARGRELRTRADPLTLEIETLILSTLGAEQRRQLRLIIDSLSTWLTSEFAGELARRYPDMSPASRKPRS